MGALALALAASFGCSGEESSGPTPGARRDIDRLRLLMIMDPARQPIEEAERVATGRPVEAARRLRAGGIPASRRQVEAATALELQSDQGRRFKRRLITAYRDRVTALEQYADVLEGAASDEDALLDAIRAQARVELAILAIDEDLEALDPTPRPEEEEEPAEPPAGTPRERPLGAGATGAGAPR